MTYRREGGEHWPELATRLVVMLSSAAVSKGIVRTLSCHIGGIYGGLVGFEAAQSQCVTYGCCRCRLLSRSKERGNRRSDLDCCS